MENTVNVARSKSASPRCPFCHESIAADADVSVCRDCFAPTHTECWDDHGHCPSCGGVTRIQQQTSDIPEGSFAARRKPKSQANSAKSTEFIMPISANSIQHGFGTLYLFNEIDLIRENLESLRLNEWQPIRQKLEHESMTEIVRRTANSLTFYAFIPQFATLIICFSTAIPVFLEALKSKSLLDFSFAVLLLLTSLIITISMIRSRAILKSTLTETVEKSHVSTQTMVIQKLGAKQKDYEWGGAIIAADSTLFLENERHDVIVQYLDGSVPPAETEVYAQQQLNGQNVNLYKIKLLTDFDRLQVGDVLVTYSIDNFVLAYDRLRGTPKDTDNQASKPDNPMTRIFSD